MKRKVLELKLKAAEIRKEVLSMAEKSGSGHIAPGLSCTDILTTLYYGGILNIDPKNQEWKDRDRFVLSKGHGCMPLYVILSDRGYFDKKHLDTFCKPGSILGCHADRKLIPGVEVTTGSLGLGLAVATGMALAAKYDKKNHRIFALLGDGECQEGTIWESLMYAGSNGFDNLTIIIDHNGYGATARLKDTANVHPLAKKLKAFNFGVKEVDGHNINKLLPALQSVPYKKGKPSAIVAHTTKGKGISFMEKAYAEGDPKWHYRVPKDDNEWNQVKKDLESAISKAKNDLGLK